VVQNLKDEFMILQHLTEKSQRKAQKKKEKGELQVMEQYTPKVYFYSSD
jgi:phage antirepressor YoqD-like protein